MRVSCARSCLFSFSFSSASITKGQQWFSCKSVWKPLLPTIKIKRIARVSFWSKIITIKYQTVPSINFFTVLCKEVLTGKEEVRKKGKQNKKGKWTTGPGGDMTPKDDSDHLFFDKNTSLEVQRREGAKALWGLQEKQDLSGASEVPSLRERTEEGPLRRGFSVSSTSSYS